MKKKISLGNKLALDKETISKLDDQQLREIAGGAVNSLSCNKPAAAVENDPDDDVMEDFNSCCNASCNTRA